MERGVLVPDDVTIEMVKEWINAPEQAKGFVLDGFPRTVTQAQALDQELDGKGPIEKVLYINVSREELIRRLTGRLVCRRCQAPHHAQVSPPRATRKCDRCGGELYRREDDKPEAVNKRMQVYMEQTEPLAQNYRRVAKLMEIDGEGSVDEVEQALLAAVR
jgi:adenylate kinase